MRPCPSVIVIHGMIMDMDMDTVIHTTEAIWTFWHWQHFGIGMTAPYELTSDNYQANFIERGLNGK